MGGDAGQSRLVGATSGECMQQIEVEGGKGTVALGNDGIIHLLWNSEARIEVHDARAAMTAVNAVANGSESPLLVDMTTVSISRHARSVFRIPCAASRIALLGKSPVDLILANWAMGQQNLPCPTRFFSSETEAISWLHLPNPPS